MLALMLGTGASLIPTPSSLDGVRAQNRPEVGNAQRMPHSPQRPANRNDEDFDPPSQIAENTLSRSTADSLMSPRLLNGPHSSRPDAKPADSQPLVPQIQAAQPGGTQKAGKSDPVEAAPTSVKPGPESTADEDLLPGRAAADSRPPGAQAAPSASASADHMYDDAAIKGGELAKTDDEPTRPLVPDPGKGETAKAAAPAPAVALASAQPAQTATVAKAGRGKEDPSLKDAVICIAGCSGEPGLVVDAHPSGGRNAGNNNSGLIKAAFVTNASVQQAANMIVCMAGCYSTPSAYPARVPGLVHRTSVVTPAAKPTDSNVVKASTGDSATTAPTAPHPVAGVGKSSKKAAESKPRQRAYRSSEWFTSRFKGKSPRS